ncbi:RNA-guided endonuclease InsQ/TnpB family protein [Rothia dentocariosa]|uniref:RNA-guided endonuclease InsQ/TnpB family protein n=1 Tax=Rothia dentocariosa TaxID=2047 RepID=UPI00066137C2|nr:RNA-guided endonuclease TnpB family protein [Rothia dentocariosa]
MATTDKKDKDKEKLRAYKFRLDPNQAQTIALYQAAGAARYTYNMLTAYNLEVNRLRDDYWKKRHDEGISDADIKKELNALTKEDKRYKQLKYGAFGTQYLTPEKKRHEQAEHRIENGEDPSVVWNQETERSANPWLHTANQRVLVSGLQNASDAWDNFWASRTGKRAGRLVGAPRFKKKGISRDSFTVPAAETMGAYGTAYLRGEAAYQQGKRTITDYRHVRLSYLGVIRTYDSTKPLVKAVAAGAEIRSYTVSRNADRWYVSFLVKFSEPIRRSATKRARAAGAVGVDLGVKYLASLSDSEAPQRFPNLKFAEGLPSLENPRWSEASSRRLHKLQRALARSQKGSNRRSRLVKQIARLHHMTALRRESNLHQLTKKLSTGYTLVGLEDLNVSGMTASAKGTVENPGKNVAQKSGLNRVVLDAAFGVFRYQLEYKTAWYGSTLEKIDRYFASSQTCSECGRKAKTKLTLRDRVFDCAYCGNMMDRDFNAAVNICREAQRLFNKKLASENGESLNGRGSRGALQGAETVEASRPPTSHRRGSP